MQLPKRPAPPERGCCDACGAAETNGDRGGGLPGAGREELKEELRAAYRAPALARLRSRAQDLFRLFSGPQSP